MGQNQLIDAEPTVLPPQAATSSKTDSATFSPGSATESKDPRSEERHQRKMHKCPWHKEMVKPNDHYHTHLGLTLSPDWLHTIDPLFSDLGNALGRHLKDEDTCSDIEIFTLPENLKFLHILQKPRCIHH